MPPKPAAKAQKVVEDKTFGLKNKKGKKQQEFVKQVQKNAENKFKVGQPDERKKMKELEAQRKAEINSLFKPVLEKKQVVADSMSWFILLRLSTLMTPVVSVPSITHNIARNQLLSRCNGRLPFVSQMWIPSRCCAVSTRRVSAQKAPTASFPTTFPSRTKARRGTYTMTHGRKVCRSRAL
jgi:hypothetical protein